MKRFVVFLTTLVCLGWIISAIRRPAFTIETIYARDLKIGDYASFNNDRDRVYERIVSIQPANEGGLDVYVEDDVYPYHLADGPSGIYQWSIDDLILVRQRGK